MREKSNKKSKKWILIIVAVVVVAAIVAVIGLNNMGKPVDPKSKNKVSVTVEKGQSTEGIGESLHEKGLINSVFSFKLKSKMAGNDGKYQPGVYSLSKSQSIDEMMNVIVSGKSDVTRFTIPEGYTTEQTKNALVKTELVTEESFWDAVEDTELDYEFLKDAPNDERKLEGFLYPDTYEVYKNATADDIIHRMLAQFDSLFSDEFYKRAKELNMSVRDIVTIASLIERETKVPDERAKVASVIYNRIDKGMYLQIDATIQYILDEPKEHLLYSDLKIESPYNTYLYDGLPPGPICSPRLDSIKAALYPDKTDYLYYVATPELDGTHNFSATAAEFEKNKAAYKKAVANQ